MARASEMSLKRRKEIMAKISNDRDVLRTNVRQVAQGYTTALFVYGPGGLGKTHIITQELDDLLAKGWVHHTAYSTPASLFETLDNEPSAVHLFEDCERLYKQDLAAGILRAACGSPRDKARWITYETARESRRVQFTGGIIIVSNESLAKGNGILQAVASRFRPAKWDLTTEERIACILDMADAGSDRAGRKLTPAQCREVAEYLVDEMSATSGQVAVDFRTYHEHALPTYCQWLDCPSGPHWHDVLASKLQGDVNLPESREAKAAKHEELAYLIDHDAALKGIDAKIARWKDATGLGKSQYYIHLRNAKPQSVRPVTPPPISAK